MGAVRRCRRGARTLRRWSGSWAVSMRTWCLRRSRWTRCSSTCGWRPLRKTLRRAALIFAGRIPTEAEYASIYTSPTALRTTIRNLMTGPEFHDFLIRGANDRLLTDRYDGDN